MQSNFYIGYGIYIGYIIYCYGELFIVYNYYELFEVVYECIILYQHQISSGIYKSIMIPLLFNQ